ncbi:MAG: hypothetical protein HF978_11385 [Desulfobacteraceae bacterium]|nr:hypothetical protein [Desulfobacteraceae bacterium]MBC2756139.1 hypothetical protein [Desulfobacteraceae bacterium]
MDIRTLFKPIIICICVIASSLTGIRGALADEPVSDQCKWKYYNVPELSNAEIYQSALQAARHPAQYIHETNQMINDFSNKMGDYIYLWLDGKGKDKVNGKFPDGFFSQWVDNEKTHDWQLIKPNKIRPEDQWYAMGVPYDPDKELHQCSPDPHVTYLKLIFLAPLNSKLLIDGDFPHCRFMDYQIILPLDSIHPQESMCEVPLVDVDIEPDPGHVNPFRVGADRNARKRHYHIEFELKAGNAVKLNPEAMKPPEYRAPGNKRVGGPFQLTSFQGGHVIVPAVLWLRYYSPDKEAGSLGGVSLPKATLQLPSGENFWITCDKSLAVERQSAPVPRISETPAIDPYSFMGPSLGWFKMYDILFSHMEANGYYTSWPWGIKNPEITKKRIRENFRLIHMRGVDASPPGNYETGPTCCNYISYLVRPISLGEDNVIVLTGKLPTFPRTRDAEPMMTGGQVRYFSITHQLGSNSEYNEGYLGTPYGSLMDDEIVTNVNNEYVIVYSRQADRPDNAKPEFGITWQRWGEPTLQSLVLRWLSVMPDWYLPEYAPDQNNVPWEIGAWSQDTYDKSLVGSNGPGVMGHYHPVIHYMSKEQFEQLGYKWINPEDVPEWGGSLKKKAKSSAWMEKNELHLQ